MKSCAIYRKNNGKEDFWTIITMSPRYTDFANEFIHFVPKYFIQKQKQFGQINFKSHLDSKTANIVYCVCVYCFKYS